MARRPRTRSRKPQSNLATPLAVFVMLFVFSFGFALYFYVSWRDADAKIWGSYKPKQNAKYEKVDLKGEQYYGYIAQLEDKDTRLEKFIRENDDFKEKIGIEHLDQLEDKFSGLKGKIEGIDQLSTGATTFVELVRRIANGKYAVETRLADSESAKEEANRQLDETQGKLETRTNNLNESIDELQTKLTNRTRERDELQTSLEGTISDLKREIAKHKNENEKQRVMYKKETQLAKQEVIRLRSDLKEVQRHKVGTTEFSVDYAEVDGIILNTGDFGRFCNVDIGLKDGAKVGLTFLVYDTSPGGKRREKGRIELKKVGPEFSYAGIITVNDELDPILEDDIIISPIFKRGQPNIFVLEEDIDKIDAEVIKRKIERYGNKVDEAVSPKTDFVVIQDTRGKRAEEAEKLAVTIIRLSYLSKVLGED